jgi:hypothetical protein
MGLGVEAPGGRGLSDFLAVLVSARQEEDVISAEAMVASEGVGHDG